MSGGAYDYLYCRDAEHLVSGQADEAVDRMGQRLAKLGWTKEIAQHKAVMDKIEEVRGHLRELHDYMEEISPIWRAVEWNDSGDGSAVFDSLAQAYDG